MYIVFHVDDFNVAGTDKKIITEFHEHLEKKYEVTSNEKGVFLGIMRTELADGRTLFTKPFIMKKLLETYLPDGSTMSIPTTPMHPTYLEYLKNKNKLDIQL